MVAILKSKMAKHANSSLANYLPQFWKPQGTFWYRLPASTQNV